MANFWDNDEVVTDAAPSKVNFWDFDEIVELLDVATTPDTSPVSEDPDREFFQSGVGMEDRIFEPAPVDTAAPETSLRPEAREEKADPFLNILTKRLIAEEQYESKAYLATKGEKFLTIGYGHYGSDVKPNQTISKKDAKALLLQDINVRLPAIRSAIPSFDSLSTDLKVEIAQSWFRGGMSGSPATIKLINQGKFEEAAAEFLNNDEYKTARQRGRSGIIPRMDAVADALEDEGK
jgi:GH24 family phage-related lysozyme (muramidase)